MKGKMRAVQLSAFGGPEVLRLASVDIPIPAAGDVLLKVAGCGIDRKDLLIRSGVISKKSGGYRGSAGDAKSPLDFPLTLGTEISGTVVEVGAGVVGVAPGDRVACLPRRGHCGQCKFCRSGRNESCPSAYFIGQDVDGGYAEYVLVGPDSMCKVPDGVDLVEAALGAACIGTMVRAVRDIGQVKLGETVLITGATGGLGVHGIQLAKLAGAQVLALASSAAKADFLRGLGADKVIVAAHGTEWSSQVLDATDGQGVDVAIDIVGASAFKSVLKSMALYGRLVTVGEVGSGSVDMRPAIILLKRLQILGSYSPNTTHLATALQLLERGAIRAVIDSRLPFEDAAAAHARMEAGGVAGRIVLVP